MKMGFNNTFGAATSANGIDLQRNDLWKVDIKLPPAVGFIWATEVSFLLEKFPFPTRDREMIPVKYMQQTNFIIGKDTDTSAIEIPVRYAFNTNAASALERWFWLVSNPKTGGVGLTSALKAMGTMTWLVPNMQRQIQDLRSNADPNGSPALDPGLVYTLEGCIIKGLKFTDGDMTGSGYVNMMFNLQMDRYYPDDMAKLNITPSLAS